MASAHYTPIPNKVNNTHNIYYQKRFLTELHDIERKSRILKEGSVVSAFF